ALRALTGSPTASLAGEDSRTRRAGRGTANRRANFGEAERRRSARPAGAAGARGERALENPGRGVPDRLRDGGQPRAAPQQASVAEVGQLADPAMTKDAVAGRIRRLLSTADKHAEELGTPATEASLAPEMLEDR